MRCRLEHVHEMANHSEGQSMMMRSSSSYGSCISGMPIISHVSVAVLTVAASRTSGAARDVLLSSCVTHSGRSKREPTKNMVPAWCSRRSRFMSHSAEYRTSWSLPATSAALAFDASMARACSRSIDTLPHPERRCSRSSQRHNVVSLLRWLLE